MKRNNAFYYLLALCFTATVQGCSDDDNEIIIDDEEIVEWVRPTEDEIKTHISKTALLFGKFDEVTERLIARIDMPQYGNTSRSGDFIPDDAELIIMDNSSLLSLSMEQVEELHQAYQDGATVYLHKPNAFGAAFFYAAMMDGPEALLGETRAADDDDSWLYPYDVVAMHRDKGMYHFGDAHSDEPFTTTVTITEVDEETGVETTTEKEETVYPLEPNNAEFGVYAEDVAEWINESVSKTTRSRAVGDGDELNQVPGKISIPTKIAKSVNHLKEVVYLPTDAFSIRYWVSNLYNFDKNQDYYHLVLEEELDGKAYWIREFYNDGSNMRAAGSILKWLKMDIVWLDSNGYKLHDQWNEQPLTEGTVTSTETVDGWEINAEVGYDDGLTGKLTGSYKHQTTVTTLDKEISFTYDRLGNKKPKSDSFDGFHNLWKYSFGSDLIYSGSGKVSKSDLRAPSSNAQAVNMVRPRQSLNWIIDNTQKRGDEPFKLGFELDFALQATTARKKSSTKSINYRIIYPPLSSNIKLGEIYKGEIPLPVPNRFKHEYRIKPNAIGNLSEWNDLLTDFERRSPTYKKLATNPDRCGRSEVALKDDMKAEWSKIKKELSGVAYPNLSQTYEIRLLDENNQQIGETISVTTEGVK